MTEANPEEIRNFYYAFITVKNDLPKESDKRQFPKCFRICARVLPGIG
jgi:hypothetical protein